MYIIIVGASRIGQSLAQALILERQDVVIVEKDEEKARRLAESLDAIVINGSGTEIDVLKEAGANRADVVISATSDDAVNLMVCELGRILKIERKITLSSNPKHEEIFKEVGVESIIYPSATISNHIKNVILRPGVRSVLSTVSENADIVKIEIPKDALVVGKEIKDIGMPDGSTIAAIQRGNELIIPKGSTTLVGKDILTVLSKSNVVEKVANILQLKG